MDPTQDQKTQILDPHVFYLIQQLVGMFDAELPSEAGHPLRNACVESVAINCRNLLYFFETTVKNRKKKNNDDVLAEDFGLSASRLILQTNIRNRVAKEVAHLTYARIEHYEEDRRDWPYKELVPPILDRSAEFIAHLLKTHRVPHENRQAWEQLKSSTETAANHLRSPTDSTRGLRLSSTTSTSTTTTSRLHTDDLSSHL